MAQNPKVVLTDMEVASTSSDHNMQTVLSTTPELRVEVTNDVTAEVHPTEDEQAEVGRIEDEDLSGGDLHIHLDVPEATRIKREETLPLNRPETPDLVPAKVYRNAAELLADLVDYQVPSTPPQPPPKPEPSMPYKVRRVDWESTCLAPRWRWYWDDEPHVNQPDGVWVLGHENGVPQLDDHDDDDDVNPKEEAEVCLKNKKKREEEEMARKQDEKEMEQYEASQPVIAFGGL
jgi:hypothetical protein